jgi:hypothetical protein
MLRSKKRKAEGILISTGLFSRHRFDDGGVLHLDESVGNQLAQRRKQPLGRFFALDKLDAKRKVFPFGNATLGGMHPMVRPKSGLGTDQAGAGHSVLLQKGKDLVIQKVVARAGILVQVNRDFLRQSGREHNGRITFLTSDGLFFA